MTVLEQVRDFLVRQSPNPICDDCIKRGLGLSVRQHANHKSRKLACEPRFDRRPGVCSTCGRIKKVIRYA